MSKIEALVQGLLAQGATHAQLIATNQLVIDARVRLKCQVPRCDSYEQNLQCPPFCMTVEEFEKYLACYRQAIFVQLTSSLPEQKDLGIELLASETSRELVYAGANELHKVINWAESQAFAEGFRFATGFIGGCCKLCPECVGPAVKKCRYPFQARPSLEAVGVDVFATSHKLGMPIVFPVQNNVTWCGLLLLE